MTIIFILLITILRFMGQLVPVSENLVSEKSLGFGFRKFGLGKKYWFRFRRIWSRIKSIGFGFGKFGLGKKVLVLVSENLVSEKKSRYRFRSKFWYRHSVWEANYEDFGIWR